MASRSRPGQPATYSPVNDVQFGQRPRKRAATYEVSAVAARFRGRAGGFLPAGPGGPVSAPRQSVRTVTRSADNLHYVALA